jgi:cytochrome P450
MSSRTAIPPHVPPELVRSFNFWSAPGMKPEAGGDPHAALACLRDEPRIFYSARNTAEGYGTWVLTRAEDMRAVLQDAAAFSSSRKLFSPLVGEAEDFATFLVDAKVDGRPLNGDELIGMGVLVFVAGLDTVAAALGFDFNYLAANPGAQSDLRTHPERIPNAAEEMLRAFSTVHMVRVANKDVELHGVTIKAGDRVSCATMVANRDTNEFANPDCIDFKREVNRHVAFAYGPHRCVGSHLARREVIIGLEEWLRRMPPFRIKEGTAPVAHGGTVFGIEKLVLDWS